MPAQFSLAFVSKGMELLRKLADELAIQIADEIVLAGNSIPPVTLQLVALLLDLEVVKKRMLMMG